MSALSSIARAARAIPDGERVLRPYLFGIAAVAIVTATILLFGSSLSVADASMLHLLPILMIAVRFGIWPSIATSVAAAFSCNYFFSRPYFGLGFQDLPDIITLLTFVVTATTVNYWAGEAHRQSEVLRRSRARTELLYAINKCLAGLRDPHEIVRSVHDALPDEDKVSLALYLSHGGVLELASAVGNTWAGSAEESRAAELAYRKGLPSGRGTALEGESLLHYVPLIVDGAALGVLGLGRAQSGSDELCGALASEIAQVIGRARRLKEREQANIVAEVAKLQSALVSSISHDFRTPLTTIIGAATSLQDEAAGFPPDARRELLATIQTSGQRLHRYVTNLLNTGRLEAGALKLNRDWTDIADLIEVARNRLSSAADQERIELAIADHLPLFSIDATLIDQVFSNLLDNATKYSPPGSTISVKAFETPEDIAIEVANVAITPPPDIARMFDRFHRPAARSGGGSGLGLSICKGFVEAHDGTIGADYDCGTLRITMRFPKKAFALHVTGRLDDE